MRNRCERTNDRQYKDYGGRGIKVCERWGKFANFLEDMGLRPEGTTLDRIDNDGNYEVNNCRWIDRKSQNRNRRDNRIVTFMGKKLCLAEACELSGVSYAVARTRLDRLGWSEEKTFSVKTDARGKCQRKKSP